MDERLRRWLRTKIGEVRGRIRDDRATADDPDFLLAEAQRQMQETHQRNRERAVRAITQKNNLQQMVDEMERKIAYLRIQSAQAEVAGNRIEADKWSAEADHYQEALETTRASLYEAIQSAEAVKAAIKAEEERVRRKTAEATALRAQWRLLQIERSMARAQAAFRARQETLDGPIVMDPEQARIGVMEAVQSRDELRVMVEEAARQVSEIKVKADFARRRGQDETERQLLREMEQSEATLESARVSLERAEATVARLDAAARGEAVEWTTYIDYSAELPAWEEADSDDVERSEKRLIWAMVLAVFLLIGLLLLLFALL